MKRKVKEIIVVEGRYDKNTLSQVVDGVIIETAGFGIFSDKEKLYLLRRLAEGRGIIILTDSDGAGFVIRNYLKGAISGSVKHAYVPELRGKEKRKKVSSKEGLLGVEGMRPEVILFALERAGATFEDDRGILQSGGDMITNADMFAAGLTGRPNSAEKRRELLKKLDLPVKISTSALLDILNALYSREEFFVLFDSNEKT